MKTTVKYLASAALAAGLMLPAMSFAGTTNPPATMTTTTPQKMDDMVKVGLHYKDAQGKMKAVDVYVPKKKVDELSKAKTVELLMCNSAVCGGRGPSKF